MSIEVDARIVAQHLGIADRIRFSDRLEWVAVGSEVVLRRFRVDPKSGRITLYPKALEARLGEDGAHRMLPDILKQCRDYDESKHPRDDHGRWTDAGGGDSGSNDVGQQHNTVAQPIDYSKPVGGVGEANGPKVAHRVGALPHATTPEPKYLRFGRIPKSGHSTVGQAPSALWALATEISGEPGVGDQLAGVSVFPLTYNKERNLWQVDDDNLAESGYASLDALIYAQQEYSHEMVGGGHQHDESGKHIGWTPPVFEWQQTPADEIRPIFLVTGEDVDEGTDGEPLLADVKVLDKLNVQDLLHKNYFDPDEDLDPTNNPTAFGMTHAQALAWQEAYYARIRKEAEEEAARKKDWDESLHPRDEDGKFTFSGGGDVPSWDEYGAGLAEPGKASRSDHPGLSSDFDLRPGQPMPSQSIIVTVNRGTTRKPSYRDYEVLVNPSMTTFKSIVGQGEPARVLQDQVGNLFAWPADNAIHAQMMDALKPVDTMWASDLFEIDQGRIVSETAPGTDKAAEWIERGRDNAKNADTATVGFVSPNVKTDLDFSGAVDALDSKQQGSLLAASTAIDRAIGIKAKEANIIGAWADGAENSIMMTSGASWDQAVLATVMKGYLANQKSVLVFQQTHGGDAVLASFHATGGLEAIHRQLLEDGLAFHTLVPTKGGATVYVCDLDGSAADAVEKASGRYDSEVTIQHGKAEFIGDTSGEGSDRAQRDRARSIYEKVIRESPVQGSAAVWASVRDRWGTAKQVGRALKRAAGLRTLYVNRPLLNADEVLAWAQQNGFTDMMEPDDLHVTVAFSKEPVDWSKFDPHPSTFTEIAPNTSVARLGDQGAVVLKFESEDLQERWREFRKGGASWDWPEYQPHVTLTYNGSGIDLKKVVPYRGDLVFGPEIFAEVDEDWASKREWDESKHPREPAGTPEGGQFASGGGGDDEAVPIADEATAVAQLSEPAKPDPNPEVVNVGGDEWNRVTAARLEDEYVSVAGKLQAIADQAVGKSTEDDSSVSDDDDDDEDAPYVPETWDMLTNSQQEQAQAAYLEQTYNDYLESEISNWHDNGDAKKDAMRQIADDYMNDEKTDWAKNALVAKFTFRGEDLQEYALGGNEKIVEKMDLPFTLKEVMYGITIEYIDEAKSNGWQGELALDFSDSNLDEAMPTGYEAGQSDLPGIESAKPHEYLTEKMREKITDVMTDAMSDHVETVESELEPPEYLADSVKEYQAESWDGMDDSDKFSWVEHNTPIIKDAQEESDNYYENKNKAPELSQLGEMPSKLDPLNETFGNVYRQTQALARIMSRERAAKLLVERSIKDDDGKVFTEENAMDHISRIDSALWRGWKESSSGSDGWLLQVATHHELGGRLREQGDTYTYDRAVKFANREYAEIGGFEGVKAMVRAKWETTQFLLDKSGMQTIEAYRGLKVKPEGYDGNGKIKSFQLSRNGAQSATTDIEVAKNFSHGGTVIRMEVPRTAVVSVPAYGQNIHSEHEIVVAGTAWKGWDAWRSQDTPYHGSHKIEHAA